MVITLNRPEARNAINEAVSVAVGDALEQAQNDPEVRVVVLTGSGDKSFCAGIDLKALSRGENAGHPGHPKWGFAGYVRHVIDKPTIAAVNGVALGGGTELALASDLVVAGESAKFGLPEVKRGLIAAAGGVFRIVDQLPRKVALRADVHRRPDLVGRGAEMGSDQRGRRRTERNWTQRWRWPSGSPSTRRSPSRPASGSPSASTTASSPTTKLDGSARCARSSTDAVRGRQGRTAGLRREAPAGLESQVSRSRKRP